jgi:hypothetical protein
MNCHNDSFCPYNFLSTTPNLLAYIDDQLKQIYWEKTKI